MKTKLIFVFAAALAVAACAKGGSSVTPEDAPQDKDVVEVKEFPVNYAPAGSFSMSDAAKGIAAKEQAFSFELLSGLRKEGESMVISPLSVQLALGMLYTGAAGETAAQIANVIGTGDALSKEAMLSYGKGVMEGLAADEDVTVRVANALVVNSAYVKTKTDYSSALLQNYYAPSVDADFSKQANDVLVRVNEWSNKVTEGMIPMLLDAVDPDVYYYLLSALYMKGSWTMPMSESGNVNFKHGNGTTEKMTFLSTPVLDGADNNYEYLGYAAREGYEVVKRALGNENYAFYVVLPKENNLSAVIESMKGEWSALVKDINVVPVWMTMPKFSQKTHADMKEALQGMGMEQVFTADAKLDNMFDAPSKVGKIYQKSSFEVNILGLEGASVTVVEGIDLSPDPGDKEFTPINFIADHPFLYVVAEETTGLILYAGVIE